MKTYHLVPLNNPSQVKLAESLAHSGTASQLSDLQRSYDRALKSHIPDDVKIQELEGVLSDLGVFQKRLMQLKREAAAEAARPPTTPPPHPVAASTPLNRGGPPPPPPPFGLSGIGRPPGSPPGSSTANRTASSHRSTPDSARLAPRGLNFSSPRTDRSASPVGSERVEEEEESSSGDSSHTALTPHQAEVRKVNLRAANETIKKRISVNQNFTANQKAAARALVDIMVNRPDVFVIHFSGDTVRIPHYQGEGGEKGVRGIYKIESLLHEMVKTTEPGLKTVNFVNQGITRGAFSQTMLRNLNKKMEPALKKYFGSPLPGTPKRGRKRRSEEEEEEGEPGTLSRGEGLYTWFTL